jgi:hypothetical protein
MGAEVAGVDLYRALDDYSFGKVREGVSGLRKTLAK